VLCFRLFDGVNFLISLIVCIMGDKQMMIVNTACLHGYHGENLGSKLFFSMPRGIHLK